MVTEKRIGAKFIVISLSVMFVILFIVTSIINIANYNVIIERTESVIKLLENNDGYFPSTYAVTLADGDIYEETPYSTRYFTIKTDADGEIASYYMQYINSVSESEAEEFYNAVIEKSRSVGFINSFRFSVSDTESGGQLFIFIDCTHSMQLFYSFLIDSIIICGIAFVAFAVLVFLMSKKFIFPITQSYAKQKQFITNVTHEFKTPLAIIKANNEVMELQNEGSQWIESTNIQVDRLDELIKRLTQMVKIDEERNNRSDENIDVSFVAKETVSGFYTLASQNNRVLKAYIADNLKYKINAVAVKTLITMLLDNAIKYSTENTKIHFIAKVEKNKLIFQCENACEGLRVGKYDKWFERFYREDESRKSEERTSNSYGIGLATAKAIVESLNGKVSAFSKNAKTVKIKMELPY